MLREQTRQHWFLLIERLFSLRKAIEAAADAVAIVRCYRMRMLDAGMACWSCGEGYVIAQIAVGRNPREPEQQRTEKQCPASMSILIGHIHHDKR